MTDGLVKSLWDNLPNVWDAFMKFGQRLIDAFNKGTESASPSKAMIRAGKNLTDGVVVGLNRGHETVLDAVDKLAQGVTVRFDKSASLGQSITTNVYNQQSTAYNLGVTTSASAPDVISNFNLLKVST